MNITYTVTTDTRGIFGIFDMHFVFFFQFYKKDQNKLVIHWTSVGENNILLASDEWLTFI